MRKQIPNRRWFAKEWLKAKGVRQAAIVAGTNHNKSEVSQWVSEKRRFNADVLEEFARIIGVPASDLLKHPSEVMGKEAVLTGRVGAGAEVIRLDQPDILGGVPLPAGIDAPNVAEIEGDSQYPLLAGWRIFYGPENQGVAEERLGKLCVVQVKDGPTLLKTLKKGSRKGLFRLESWNAPPREDVKLEWAAEVKGIIPK